MAEPQRAVAEPRRGDQIVDFVATAPGRLYPPEVIEAARRAFVDYLGVTVGSMQDPPVRAVRAAVARWQAPGPSSVFLGFKTAPALAAMVNGTSTHSQDYDDTHPLGAGHPSGPCWSTALALAEQLGSEEGTMLGAFITGYEIMAKLGGGGVKGIGRALQRNGFHPTCVVGRPGATAVAAVLLGLDKTRIASALGVAATSMSGLVGSFGTHSKPFHSGKAAMDGIMAAQFAQDGFEASPDLYELDKGWLAAFVQDRSGQIPGLDDFGQKWEILGNGFKLYASCRATHASTEAAATLREKVGTRAIERIHVKTHGHALITAGKLNPQTALEGKFSVPFCVALALRGYRLLPGDFTEPTMKDRSVMDLLPKTKIEPVVGQPPHEAHVEVWLEGGERLEAHTQILKGHPDNPLDWADLWTKFEAMLANSLSPAATKELFDIAREIDRPGAVKDVMRLVGAEAKG